MEFLSKHKGHYNVWCLFGLLFYFLPVCEQTQVQMSYAD